MICSIGLLPSIRLLSTKNHKTKHIFSNSSCPTSQDKYLEPNYHHNAINQLEMIQHRAAWFVTNNPWRRDHCDNITAILHQLSWPTLQDRCKNNTLILLFKLVNNLLIVPHHYLPSPFFPSTRANHHLKFSRCQSRTEIYRNSFFPETTI